MKNKCYSMEEIFGILKEVNGGISVKDFCRKYGVRGVQKILLLGIPVNGA